MLVLLDVAGPAVNASLLLSTTVWLMVVTRSDSSSDLDTVCVIPSPDSTSRLDEA